MLEAPVNTERSVRNTTDSQSSDRGWYQIHFRAPQILCDIGRTWKFRVIVYLKKLSQLHRLYAVESDDKLKDTKGCRMETGMTTLVQLVKILPAIYKTQKFTGLITKANWTVTIPHPCNVFPWHILSTNFRFVPKNEQDNFFRRQRDRDRFLLLPGVSAFTLLLQNVRIFWRGPTPCANTALPRSN